MKYLDEILGIAIEPVRRGRQTGYGFVGQTTSDRVVVHRSDEDVRPAGGSSVRRGRQTGRKLAGQTGTVRPVS